MIRQSSFPFRSLVNSTSNGNQQSCLEQNNVLTYAHDTVTVLLAILSHKLTYGPGTMSILIALINTVHIMSKYSYFDLQLPKLNMTKASYVVRSRLIFLCDQNFSKIKYIFSSSQSVHSSLTLLNNADIRSLHSRSSIFYTT